MKIINNPKYKSSTWEFKEKKKKKNREGRSTYLGPSFHPKLNY